MSLPLLRHAIWGHIWKGTLKSQTKEMTLHPSLDKCLEEVWHSFSYKDRQFAFYHAHWRHLQEKWKCWRMYIYQIYYFKIGLCSAWFSFSEIVDYRLKFIRQNQPLPCLICIFWRGRFWVGKSNKKSTQKSTQKSPQKSPQIKKSSKKYSKKSSKKCLKERVLKKVLKKVLKTVVKLKSTQKSTQKNAQKC